MNREALLEGSARLNSPFGKRIKIKRKIMIKKMIKSRIKIKASKAEADSAVVAPLRASAPARVPALVAGAGKSPAERTWLHQETWGH